MSIASIRLQVQHDILYVYKYNIDNIHIYMLLHTNMIYTHIYTYSIYVYIPVEPHEAVAEVSRIGNV